MKTYPLYLNEAQLRLVLDLLNASVDDIGEQIAAQLNSVQAAPSPAEMFERGAALQRKVGKTPRKLVRVTRVEALAILAERDSEAHLDLERWRNKAGSTLGWDRWMKMAHPESSSKHLWPGVALPRSSRRQQA
jgi:hypothetical protein